MKITCLAFIILPLFTLLIPFSSFALSNIESLFSVKHLPKIQNPAKNTFIYWINGDAERFRPKTGNNDDIIRVDTQDISDIEELSKSCECNIVLFYDQRGSDRWYTLRKPWGVYLKVYSNGKLIKQIKEFRRRNKDTKRMETKLRKVSNKNLDEINQADPKVLSGLLNFSQEVFPKSNLHLVYRGHSFLEPYTPEDKSSLIAPFDYSHKDSKYSFDDFELSLKNTHLKKKLTSIIFAACTMNYLDVLFRLVPYTEFVVGSQIPILETGTTGFDLKTPALVKNRDTKKEVVSKIAKNILRKFKTSKYSVDYIREAIISLVDLRGFRWKNNVYNHLILDVSDFVRSGTVEDYNSIKTSVKPSGRYLIDKIQQGVGPKTIQTLKEKVVFEDVPSTVDLFQVIKKLPVDYTLFYEDMLKRVENFGYSDFTNKSGINLKVR